MSDENKPQNEQNELNEQELDTVAGGFNPQPEPPARRSPLPLPPHPPDPDIFLLNKVGGE